MNFSIVLLVTGIVIFDSSLHEIFNFAQEILPLSNNLESPSAVRIIQSYEYPLEVHTVQTPDGYLLKMHRIPQSEKKGPSKKKTIPVFLQHGLLGSSVDFLNLGPKRSLAFVLADMGFDVWLGNLRGNIYSTAHVKLFPSDSKFWDFTWHESGIYDLPAQIDYICNKTGAPKLYYIAHSLGTTVFFVMASSLPEYNNKIEKAFLMSPLVELKNVDNLLTRHMGQIGKSIKYVLDSFTHGEFLRTNKFMRRIIHLTCLTTSFQKTVCSNILFFITGINFKKYRKEKVALFLSNFPAGYSTKGMHHFSQLIATGIFEQYDYGLHGNKIHYGSPTPPLYNVSAVTAELYFHVGPDDRLSVMADAVHLAKKLQNFKKLNLVDDPEFTHFDFILSEHAKELVYDKIFGEMEGYQGQERGLRSRKSNPMGNPDCIAF